MQVLDYKPEVPLIETWEWLTNVMRSYDGTEQRVSLRGAYPRVRFKYDYKFNSELDIRRFWNILLSAENKVFVPEYQYSTLTTQQTLAGNSSIFYNPDFTDLRAGEKVLINGEIFEISFIAPSGCTLTTNLTFDLQKGSSVTPVSEAVLEDNSSLDRYAVNYASEASAAGTYNRTRTQLFRIGTSLSYSFFNSLPVLDVRPLANNNLTSNLQSGQSVLDNNIGLIDLITEWDYSRFSISKNFLVDRIPSNLSCSTDARTDIDYWRHFLNYCRGSARKFYIITFREDLVIEGSVSSGASNILVKDKDYAEKVFSKFPTHRFIEIVTSQGTHRCEITNATIEGSDSRIDISPSLPSGWTDVERISFMLPVRIDGDTVEWEHHGLYSILNINFRTAE